MSSIVIIQARMGSTRLPGKVLADLAGRPVLCHVIERARELDCRIVVATSIDPADDAVADLAQKERAYAVRGSADDVLDRFLHVAHLMGLRSSDLIVRVCADAPLWDPGFITRCLAAAGETGAGLVLGDCAGPCAYQGAEVVRVDALWRTAHLAGDVPDAREHVTAWLRTRGDTRIARIAVPGWARYEAKLSIDTQEDLDRMRWIYGRLYRPGRIVQLREAVELLKGGEAR